MNKTTIGFGILALIIAIGGVVQAQVQIGDTLIVEEKETTEVVQAEEPKLKVKKEIPQKVEEQEFTWEELNVEYQKWNRTVNNLDNKISELQAQRAEAVAKRDDALGKRNQLPEPVIDEDF